MRSMSCNDWQMGQRVLCLIISYGSVMSFEHWARP